MSQPNGLLILGDHLFLNYKKKIGQRGLINTAGIINPNLALLLSLQPSLSMLLLSSSTSSCLLLYYDSYDYIAIN